MNARRHQKSQQQAAQTNETACRKMQSDEAEGQESQNAVDARQLRELLKSLVNSSFTQEKIMQSITHHKPNRPGLY
jgi:hypothetical protein